MQFTDTIRVVLLFGQRYLEPFGSAPTGGHLLYIVTTKLPFAPEVTQIGAVGLG